MHRSVHRAVIVGGGTAGWMTAAQLAVSYPHRLEITVVDPKTIPRTGVGEATFNTIKVFFDGLGLAETDWMPHCSATYKIAIRFEGWNANGMTFYHPFERYGVIDGYAASEWWLRLRTRGVPLDQACTSAPGISEAKRAPRHSDGTPFCEQIPHPYAYHIDAEKLANFLRDFAIARGVVHRTEEVSEVVRCPNQWIDGLTLNDGSRLESDLYIDCSGFRGLLINEGLGEPFVDFGSSLLCDRAVVGHVQHRESEIEPYTTATAMSAGWMWRIPLYDRVSVGYVYSSQFVDSEAAETEFCSQLGEIITGAQPRHLKMRVGRCSRAWVGNCVAVGLSMGFVEPLESTGIFLIQYGIAELIEHFPFDGIVQPVVDHYNRAVASCVDGVRDFLILHYVLSRRSDTPFWEAVKHEALVPDDLAERIKLWNHRLPDVESIPSAYHGFGPYSYTMILAGLDYVPQETAPRIRYASPSSAITAFAAISEKTSLLAKILPSHRAYLQRMYAGPGCP